MNKNKWILLLLCLCGSASASAADNDARHHVCHYYKWYENGMAKYGRSVPRHVQQEGVCYRIARGGYNLEIDNFDDLESYGIFQSESLRPSDQEQASQEAPSAYSHLGQEEEVAGTISRTERCRTARAQIKLLTEKNTVYEDDGAGNLIPLSREQVAERLEVARHNEALLCSGE